MHHVFHRIMSILSIAHQSGDGQLKQNIDLNSHINLNYKTVLSTLGILHWQIPCEEPQLQPSPAALHLPKQLSISISRSRSAFQAELDLSPCGSLRPTMSALPMTDAYPPHRALSIRTKSGIANDLYPMQSTITARAP